MHEMVLETQKIKHFLGDYALGPLVVGCGTQWSVGSYAAGLLPAIANSLPQKSR